MTVGVMNFNTSVHARIGTLPWILMGDSSLYMKKSNKKRAWFSEELQELVPQKLEVRCHPGGGIIQFISTLRGMIGEVCQVLGISYFGNEHIDRPMDVKSVKAVWQEFFGILRSGGIQPLQRVVFFMGGYAAKYGYGRVYDENMATIRGWIREAGFEVHTDFQKVQEWGLAADRLHFAVSVKAELAQYWKELLVGSRRPPDEDEIPPCFPQVRRMPYSMSQHFSATPSQWLDERNTRNVPAKEVLTQKSTVTGFSRTLSQSASSQPDIFTYQAWLFRHDVNQKWGVRVFFCRLDRVLMVGKITPESPADGYNKAMSDSQMPEDQIEPNDVLVKVNGNRCEDVQSYRELLCVVFRTSTQISFTFQRSLTIEVDC